MAQLSAEKRPNILFAFADDWGRYASAYAKLDGPGGINDIVRTPHFDRVARKVSFSAVPLSVRHHARRAAARCFRVSISGAPDAPPSCAARCGMDRTFLSPAPPRAGYHIGETYKVWSPGTPVDAPYDAPKHSYEKAGSALTSSPKTSPGWWPAGQNLEAAKRTLYAEVEKNFDAFLADRKAGQPFCYWFGPTNVHRKWKRGSGKALWGIDPDALKGKLPPFLPDVPVVREDLADYFGEVQAFDAALGLLLAKLEAIGELDNTIVVVSGDHGAPGFPHGKCNLYDFGSSVSARHPRAGAKGGRVVDDLTSLTDLAPTFLEAAGLPRPERMTGRSLVPLLAAEKSGQIDPQRDAVFIGRERHVENARANFLPYPQRAIRTADFLYIINFHPERGPLGDPYRLDGPNPPTAEEITEETRTTLPDEDAGPTKAWLVGMRHDPQWRSYYESAYGLRPREELYDLKSDPHQVKNVATDPAYARNSRQPGETPAGRTPEHGRSANDRERTVFRIASDGGPGWQGCWSKT